MTVLSACQQAAPVIGIETPTSVFGSTDPDAVTLAALVNECAQRILDAADWQQLKRLSTITGDGTTEAFALPSDFHRLPKDGKLWSTRIETPLTYIDSHDKWLELDIRSYEFVIGVYTILGDETLLKPAPTTGELVKFYYQSNLIFNDGTANTATALSDSDTFRLGDRLLRLALIWQWKAYKNLPYAEDMANYEYALGETIERNRGPQVITIGRQRIRKGMDIAYPQPITT